MDPKDTGLAGVSRRASPWKGAVSKMEQKSTLSAPPTKWCEDREDRHGFWHLTHGDFPPSKPFLRAMSGRRIPSRAAASLPLQDLL